MSQEYEEKEMSTNRPTMSKRNLFIIIGTLAVLIVFALIFFSRNEGAKTTKAGAEVAQKEEHTEGEGGEVELSPEALKATGIETFEVTERPFSALLRFTGTVEANQQQTQQVTPLVGGRVERVNVALGDRVRAGTVVAVISSPEVAEMRGKLHEAETRLGIAEKNYARVQRAESRAAVIQAQARLDEAEATLRRTEKLIEVGAGAGKDLIAAQAAFKSAKAEYDYQSNISINKDVQVAKAEVETSRVEASHLRNSLRALGASTQEDEGKNTSLIALLAPVSGTVTERMVNAGAGIESGKPLFTISNISTLWVIASVPESQVSRLRVGTPATVRAAALGSEGILGRVNYIDPTLNEETRTARVRVEINNPGERLKVGMFVEVGFETGEVVNSTAVSNEIAIPEEAIQRIKERTIVFVPKENEDGHFEAREIEVGGVLDGFRRVISGLKVGERVVTKGSFTLKTQLMKGEMGEE